jgi:hypothetical protein
MEAADTSETSVHFVTTRCYNPEDSKLNIQNVLGRRTQTERDDNQLILNKICYINTCPVQLQGYAYSNCMKSHVWSPRSPDINPLKFYLLGHVRWSKEKTKQLRCTASEQWILHSKYKYSRCSWQDQPLTDNEMCTVTVDEARCSTFIADLSN